MLNSNFGTKANQRLNYQELKEDVTKQNNTGSLDGAMKRPKDSTWVRLLR